jgi:hypothetical protein
MTNVIVHHRLWHSSTMIGMAGLLEFGIEFGFTIGTCRRQAEAHPARTHARHRGSSFTRQGI